MAGWLSVAVSVLCGAALIWRARLAPVSRAGASVSATQPGANGEHRQAETDEEASGAERHRKIKEAARYWDEHKARLRQLLTVEYPAAVARRNAATPEYPVVEAFGKSLQKEFENRLEKDKPEDFPLQKFLDSHLDKLCPAQLLRRDWNDSTAVADNLTVADLTRRMMSDPKMLAEARNGLAEAERTVFHDEPAAQRVEAAQTSDELMAYVTESQARYDTAINQELDAIGGGAQTRSFSRRISGSFIRHGTR